MVIACAEHPDSLGRCLESLKWSCEGIETEFIVVLTISQCAATKGWASALLSVVKRGADVAGGALALDPAASITDTAIFFLRYSAFIAGRPRYRAGAIAGDNAVYTRDTIESGGWTRESGFWEVEVNELLRRKGKRIEFAPDAVMLFGDAGGVLETAKRRYVHGRRFGATRYREFGDSVLRIVLASPLVPMILFARATRRAWPLKQYRLRLLAALPAFSLLAASWALGEAVGALEAGVANRN